MFHAASGALGIPIWIYYVGVPVLSVYVFRDLSRRAHQAPSSREGGRRYGVSRHLRSFLLSWSLAYPSGPPSGCRDHNIFQFDLGIGMVGMNFVSGIASFPLLAIPFFVLAGVILERAGLAATIACSSSLLVGRMVGGLAVVAVFTCMFWGLSPDRVRPLPPPWGSSFLLP